MRFNFAVATTYKTHGTVMGTKIAVAFANTLQTNRNFSVREVLLLKKKRSGFEGPIPLKPLLRKISKNFENRLIERCYLAAIARKYLSEVKFADRKTRKKNT